MPTGSDTDTPTHSYILRTHKKQEVERCNPRPARSTCNNVNYSNMDNSSERTSPPKKCKPANLMRYPSATVITAHKRMKEKSKRTGKPMKELTEVDPSMRQMTKLLVITSQQTLVLITITRKHQVRTTLRVITTLGTLIVLTDHHEQWKKSLTVITISLNMMTTTMN